MLTIYVSDEFPEGFTPEVPEGGVLFKFPEAGKSQKQQQTFTDTALLAAREKPVVIMTYSDLIVDTICMRLVLSVAGYAKAYTLNPDSVRFIVVSEGGALSEAFLLNDNSGEIIYPAFFSPGCASLDHVARLVLHCGVHDMFS
jgi:hypothetical protein